VHSLPTTKNDMEGYMVQWLAGSNAQTIVMVSEIASIFH
jgi:hypothetical protein